jgi:hypothetical protein
MADLYRSRIDYFCGGPRLVSISDNREASRSTRYLVSVVAYTFPPPLPVRGDKGSREE